MFCGVVGYNVRNSSKSWENELSHSIGALKVVCRVVRLVIYFFYGAGFEF